MGTSAIIIIEGHSAAKVYKHWDGGPDSTLPWLEHFNAGFSAARGDDPEYRLAALLRSSARDAVEFHLDDSPYTGWGVMPRHDVFNPCYTYWLKADGTVDWCEGDEADRLKEQRADFSPCAEGEGLY